MKDDRSIELIHAEIDGELCERDKEELHARLEADPALVALRDDLRKFSDAISRVDQAEPPAGLRARILAAVRPRKRRGLFASIVPSWPAPVMLRYAGAAVFGAAVAAVALQVGTMHSSGPADVRDLVGTIASYQTPASPQSIISIYDQGLKGEIETHRQDNLVVIDFNLTADQPVQIVADYGESGLTFGGFAQLAETAASLDGAAGRIAFHQGSEHRYAVFFNASGGTEGIVELRFLANDQLIRAETIEVPAIGRN